MFLKTKIKHHLHSQPRFPLNYAKAKNRSNRVYFFRACEESKIDTKSASQTKRRAEGKGFWVEASFCLDFLYTFWSSKKY